MKGYIISNEEMERRIEELEKQRKIISAEIRVLKQRMYNRKHFKPSINKNTLVYKVFGKPVKDLTIEEKKKIRCNKATKSQRQENSS